MNVLFWILQILAALLYGASGVMKVFMLDQVSEGVPSFGALPREAWIALGIIELVCVVGLIVPSMLRKPMLTVVAATILAIESLVFVWVHVQYQEAVPTFFSGLLGVVMAFIAYGRKRQASNPARTYVAELRALHARADLDFELRPPATEEDLAEAERTIGFRIENGLRDLWRVTDGADYWTTFFRVTSDEPTPLRFLSVAEAVAQWHEQQGTSDRYDQEFPRDERIAQGWANPRWLPFAELNGFSTCVMYDRAPRSSGTDGQIIVYQHDPDAIYFVADTFRDFLKASIHLLRDEELE